MNAKRTSICAAAIMVISAYVSLGWAENIDSDNNGSQYVWSENAGWFNFEPGEEPGVHVSETALTGYAWAANIGWINLSPMAYGGVFNDGAGNLSGYAWSENVGWINFNPIYGGVSINGEGDFNGFAWGENIGWICFDATRTYNIRVCMVILEDLAGFAADWLDSGEVPGNLDKTGAVDLADFSILSAYWLNYCPDDWPL